MQPNKIRGTPNAKTIWLCSVNVAVRETKVIEKFKLFYLKHNCQSFTDGKFATKYTKPKRTWNGPHEMSGLAYREYYRSSVQINRLMKHHTSRDGNC
jgi:hypothetical protein